MCLCFEFYVFLEVDLLILKLSNLFEGQLVALLDHALLSLTLIALLGQLDNLSLQPGYVFKHFVLRKLELCNTISIASDFFVDSFCQAILELLNLIEGDLYRIFRIVKSCHLSVEVLGL